MRAFPRWNPCDSCGNGNLKNRIALPPPQGHVLEHRQELTSPVVPVLDCHGLPSSSLKILDSPASSLPSLVYSAIFQCMLLEGLFLFSLVVCLNFFLLCFGFCWPPHQPTSVPAEYLRHTKEFFRFLGPVWKMLPLFTSHLLSTFPSDMEFFPWPFHEPSCKPLPSAPPATVSATPWSVLSQPTSRSHYLDRQCFSILKTPGFL